MRADTTTPVISTTIDRVRLLPLVKKPNGHTTCRCSTQPSQQPMAVVWMLIFHQKLISEQMMRLMAPEYRVAYNRIHAVVG